MLFLVTMTHTAENCPAYDPEKMREGIESAEKVESAAKELNLKLHFQVTAILEHTTYTLVETDSPEALTRFFGAIPFPQEFRVTPVEHLGDMIKRTREMLQP